MQSEMKVFKIKVEPKYAADSKNLEFLNEHAYYNKTLYSEKQKNK